MLASLRSSMLGKGVTCLSASQFDSLLKEPQMFNQSTSPNQLFIYKFQIGSQDIKSLDLSRMMNTLKFIQSREEQTGKVLETRSLISMQVISVNDSSNERWRKRVDTYTKHSEKFNHNIPLMGYYERQSDGGMTRTLYLASLPFVEEVNESHSRAIDLIQNWYLFKYNRGLSTLNNVKSVEELLESGSELLFSDLNCIVKLFSDLASGLSELHAKGLTHNSILPRNITMFHTEGGFEFLTTVPSFGLDNNVDGVNDDHMSYFSPQVYSRFEEGVEEVFTTQNDVFMLGTLFMRILLGEEFDAKQIDSDYWDSEIGDFKKTIIARFGKIATGTKIEILTDLACRCVSPSEDSRPTIDEIVGILTPLVVQSYGASTLQRSSSLSFGQQQDELAIIRSMDESDEDDLEMENEIYADFDEEEEQDIPLQNMQAKESSMGELPGSVYPPSLQSEIPSQSLVINSKEGPPPPPSRGSVVSMAPPTPSLTRNVSSDKVKQISKKSDSKQSSSSSSTQEYDMLSRTTSNKLSTPTGAVSFTTSAATSSSFQPYSPKPTMVTANMIAFESSVPKSDLKEEMKEGEAINEERNRQEEYQRQKRSKNIYGGSRRRAVEENNELKAKKDQIEEEINEEEERKKQLEKLKKKKQARKEEKPQMNMDKSLSSAPSRKTSHSSPKILYDDNDDSYGGGMDRGIDRLAQQSAKLDQTRELRSEKFLEEIETQERKSKSKSSFSFSWRDLLSIFSFLSRIFGGSKAKAEACEPTSTPLFTPITQDKPVILETEVAQLDDSLQKKEKYIVQKRLSDGASAIILQVKDKDTGDVHVMKRFREGVESDYLREVKCLKLFSHKNIVQFVDNFSYTETTDGKSVKSNIVIMEYCTFGDLYKLSMSFTTGKPKPMRPLRMLKFTLQLFEAIAHIHEYGFVHSDIKPQNIFLAKDGTLKLGDFGFTVKEKDTVAGGTLHYLPVEQEEGQPAVLASDLYSAACSMFEVLVKKKVSLKSKQGAPTSFEEVWDQHNKNNIHFHRKKYNPHAMGLFEVFKNCLETDHTKRRPVKEIVETLRGLLQNHSATMVQKRYRGYHARKSFKK